MSSNGRLLYSKRQTGHIYRSWLHPFGRPTVLRERDAIKGLRLLDVRVPEMVFCEARRDSQHQWKALLVTASLDGFDEIDNWYAAGGRERYGELVHERVLRELVLLPLSQYIHTPHGVERHEVQGLLNAETGLLEFVFNGSSR